MRLTGPVARIGRRETPREFWWGNLKKGAVWKILDIEGGK